MQITVELTENSRILPGRRRTIPMYVGVLNTHSYGTVGPTVGPTTWHKGFIGAPDIGGVKRNFMCQSYLL